MIWIKIYLKILNYLFKSKVDSNWKTCAREKTVLVFFFLFVCIEPFGCGDELSDGRSGLSGPSSSIISCPSSSDSAPCKYAGCGGGVFGTDEGGLRDGDGFSVVFVELSIKINIKRKHQ